MGDYHLMRIKKFGIAVALVTMCVMVTACGSKNNAGNEPGENTTTQAQQGYRSDVSCADLEAAVAGEFGDDYLATDFVDEVEHLGLTADMYTDFVYRMPMISVHVDTLIIVKAAEGRLEDVKAALNGYRDTLIADQMQYPSNLVKIHNSIIRVYGDYVAFIQLGSDFGEKAGMQAVEKNPEISDDELSRLEAEAVLGQNEQAAKIIENKLLVQ